MRPRGAHCGGRRPSAPSPGEALADSTIAAAFGPRRLALGADGGAVHERVRAQRRVAGPGDLDEIVEDLARALA